MALPQQRFSHTTKLGSYQQCYIEVEESKTLDAIGYTMLNDIVYCVNGEVAILKC